MCYYFKFTREDYFHFIVAGSIKEAFEKARRYARDTKQHFKLMEVL